MRSIIFGAAAGSRSARFLAEASRGGFSYATVGMTRHGGVPPGFVEDRTDIELGRGPGAFEAAKAALAAWRMFDLGWVRVFPRAPELRERATVCVAARAFGMTFLNACRVAYVVDEPDRYGFAYGTLEAHAESGEELFVVERGEDGRVSYRIRALSRPNRWYVRLGYPAARALQKRFARDSAAAMRAAVPRVP